LHRAEGVCNLQLLANSEVADRTDFDRITSKRNVGEHGFGCVFSCLPRCGLIGKVHKLQQRLPIEMDAGALCADGKG
jgi:hypothetical protein